MPKYRVNQAGVAHAKRLIGKGAFDTETNGLTLPLRRVRRTKSSMMRDTRLRPSGA